MNTTETPDRRVLRTRTALRDALLSLLPERGWDELSVQDICARANVGRSTFYMHFQGKEQLLEGGLNDLRDLLRAEAGRHRDPAEMLPFAHGLIAHIDQQRRLFGSIIGRRGGHVVQQRFRDMVLQLVEQDLARFAGAGWRRDASAHYIAGALVALLAWWIESGAARPIDEIERHMRELTRRLVAGGEPDAGPAA